MIVYLNQYPLQQHFSTAGTSPVNGTKKVCSGTKKSFENSSCNTIQMIKVDLMKQALSQSEHTLKLLVLLNGYFSHGILP